MKNLIFVLCWSFLLLLTAAAIVRADEKPGACLACHSLLGGSLAQPIKHWQASVHRQNNITCDRCHGGNAEVDIGNIFTLSPEQFQAKQLSSMSKSLGFVGKPAGRALFDLCAKCHADTVATYTGSIMGRAYLEGKGGPSCVTCHHAHNNVIPPVPGICESCHQDTSGYNRIDPMNVTEATISELSRIRVELAEKKARGTGPLVPGYPEELETYQIGLTAFGAVGILLLIGWLVYAILEQRR